MVFRFGGGAPSLGDCMIHDQLIFSFTYVPYTSQHVPLTALTPGHTLKNLLTLVTHTQLGRWRWTALFLDFVMCPWCYSMYRLSIILTKLVTAESEKLIVGLRVFSPRLVSARRSHPLMRKRVWWPLSTFLVVPSQQSWFLWRENNFVDVLTECSSCHLLNDNWSISQMSASYFSSSSW